MRKAGMSETTIQIPKKLTREAIIQVREDKKGVGMSISSEEPYLRYDWRKDEEYWEVLDHSREGLDDTRLKAGVSMLYNHNRDIVLGTTDGSYCCDGKKCHVEPILSEAEHVRGYVQQIQEGTLNKTSVGYQIQGAGKKIGERDGKPIYKFKWMPYEFSAVSIPADFTVGVGRGMEGDNLERMDVSIESDSQSCKSTSKNEKEGLAKVRQNGDKREMSEPANTPEINIEAERQAGATAFRERAKKINDFAKEVRERRKVNADDIASEYIYGAKNEKSFDDFRAEVLMRFDDLKPVETSPELGLSKKEVKSFSLMRAIRNISQKKFDGTFEHEVSEAAAKHYRKSGISETTIILPEEIANYAVGQDQRGFDQAVMQQAALWGQRAQNVTTATAGGFTVPTILGSMIELLRNKTVLGRAGITQLSGLQGDLALPVQTGGATAYWVSENGALADSQATFQQKTLTPHRLGGTIPFTTQFLAQSSLPAEQFVRSELMTVLAIALDLAGLLGTGTDGQPLGIANTTGINATVTYGGAATWADVVEHETGVAVDNADIGDMKFILSSAAVGKWKTILRDSVAGAKYLIDDDMTANGYEVLRTNQISAANQSFFGVFSQLILATWAGMEVIVDPYTLKKSGQVEVTMNTMHDYLCRQPLAFNVSTDSAAQ